MEVSGAAEVVRPVWPWPYQYLRPINMGVAFGGCVSLGACAVCNVD